MATVAVAFLARGADDGWDASCARFLASYRRYRPGIDHLLYVIFKGFSDACALNEAENLFKGVRQTPVFLDDNSFDIGAYIECADQISEDLICVLNTSSEVLADDWLWKLAKNLTQPNVGLVGATASYESLEELNNGFPVFPNIHIRSNAFMIDRNLFRHITEGLVVSEKIDTFRFESGAQSLTRQIISMGREVLLVGRNGRGYSPKWWPMSNTFRQGTQSNLLIADNQTRNFAANSWPEKREIALTTWGQYINGRELLDNESVKGISKRRGLFPRRWTVLRSE